MKKDLGWLLLGLLFIFEAILSFLGYDIFLKYSGWTNISTNGSIYLLFVGCVFFI